MRKVVWTLLVGGLLSSVLFGQEKQKKLDPCNLLTATDAAAIMGAPMKIVDLSKNSCTYGQYRGRGSFVTGGILDRALFFDVKKYKDPQAKEKAWTKDTNGARDPANKDQTQVLSGIGDEAYLVGRTNDGKLAENAAIDVRKSAAIFSIAIMLPPGHEPVTPSADALIAAAKKIADQL
jgi:hypothetical protein